MFIFDGGRLDPRQISCLKPHHNGVKRYAFLGPDEA
jgi:hypothetical protein